MKIKAINRCLVTLCAGLFCFCVQAQTVGVDAAASLEETLLETRSLTANFIEQGLDPQGRELQESRGTLSIRKPDHFSWHYTYPFEELKVTNGVKMWGYEPDMNEVYIDAFDPDYDSNPAMLFSADAETFSSRYDITLYEDKAEKYFVLTPLESDAFTSMSLTFDDAVLVEMQFEDSLGRKTYVSFHDIEINIDLPEELFELVPPAGVDIIDSTL